MRVSASVEAEAAATVVVWLFAHLMGALRDTAPDDRRASFGAMDDGAKAAAEPRSASTARDKSFCMAKNTSFGTGRQYDV